MKSISFCCVLACVCQPARRTTHYVKSEKTGEERNVKTNDGGNHSVTDLSPASYSIEAKAPALGPTQYANIQLTVGRERVVNIILQPAAITQE
jgi:hypothetical protein